MSVTSAKGFRAAGVAAGLKTNGGKDVAVVVNDGPEFAAAGLFTANRIKAAPVQWSETVMKNGQLRAVVLNSGGANACTGQVGYEDTVRTAGHAAERLGVQPNDIAVCSTGLIGEFLPMAKLIKGATSAIASLDGSQVHGADAAEAIITTDSHAKTAVFTNEHFTVGGMAKGAGMLAPALATMLVTITTDAALKPAQLRAALRRACAATFDRIDSDGCMSTNDTVLLLASGASGYTPIAGEFEAGLLAVCADLASQLIGDAEGSTKEIAITVMGADSTEDAVLVGKAIAGSNLFKCAVHGEDPNWGRVLAAIGTTQAAFEPDEIDVAINDVWVCRNGAAGDDRTKVDMSDRNVVVKVDLHAGTHEATIMTNDLSAQYVHENSAYAT